MQYVEVLFKMLKDYSHICKIVLLFCLNLGQNQCLCVRRKYTTGVEKVVIKYLDNENKLAEIKLPQVLRTMEAKQKNQ